VTSTPWRTRAASTTSTASCHHGGATSNGASAPCTVPSLLHSTSVTVRGTPRPYGPTAPPIRVFAASECVVRVAPAGSTRMHVTLG
jgi:hypothetical protein